MSETFSETIEIDGREIAIGYDPESSNPFIDEAGSNRVTKMMTRAVEILHRVKKFGLGADYALGQLVMTEEQLIAISKKLDAVDIPQRDDNGNVYATEQRVGILCNAFKLCVNRESAIKDAEVPTETGTTLEGEEFAIRLSGLMIMMAVCLGLCLPAFADNQGLSIKEETEHKFLWLGPDPPKNVPGICYVEGLTKVERFWQNPLKHKLWPVGHQYTYKLANTTQPLVTTVKISGQKDLRTYSEAKPVKNWIQKFCARWNTTTNMAFTIAMPLVQAFKKGGR